MKLFHFFAVNIPSAKIARFLAVGFHVSVILAV